MNRSSVLTLLAYSDSSLRNDVDLTLNTKYGFGTFKAATPSGLLYPDFDAVNQSHCIFVCLKLSASNFPKHCLLSKFFHAVFICVR